MQIAFDKNMTPEQKKAALIALKNKDVAWLKANCQKTMNADEDLSFFEDDLTELTTYIIRRRRTPRVVYVRHDEDESTELKESWQNCMSHMAGVSQQIFKVMTAPQNEMTPEQKTKEIERIKAEGKKWYDANCGPNAKDEDESTELRSTVRRPT